MTKLTPLVADAAAPWTEIPAEKLIHGTPQVRTVVLYENASQKLSAGTWEASPGKWRVAYSEWEYVEVVSGTCLVEGDDGQQIAAGPGDKFVIEPGFTGTWEVLSAMQKNWVVRE